MGRPDIHSFANFDEVVVRHLALKLECDFAKKRFFGSVDIKAEVLKPGTEYICLDVDALDIQSVKDASGADLAYDMPEKGLFGSMMRVKLPSGAENVDITVTYSTTDGSGGLQWLEPGQTAGKKHPYCFSQLQAILARTMVPCQDTPSVKAPFTFAVTVPKDLVGVCSGLPVGAPVVDEARGVRTFTYEQKVPVMSYLIAVCCGNLASTEIGPRSIVYAEPEMLESCKYELDGVTEEYLVVAAQVCGIPYDWGNKYDVVVLPSSFAYGGMENPNLTFFSSSLLAGDRSLTTTLAHEITHSWSGNWVTNALWADFWLNEGFTRYIERRILGQLYGQAYRGLLLTFGYFDLMKNVEFLSATPNLTTLLPDLTKLSPDDAFSRIPYEKGSLFLYYLEKTVGGEEAMSGWLKEYFSDFSKASITTAQMKAHFIAYFTKKGTELSAIDWDYWLLGEGLPDWDLSANIDRSMIQRSRELADMWAKGGDGAANGDLAGMKAHQVMVFLDNVINDGNQMSPELLAKMDQMYGFSTSGNVEVGYRWFLLNLRNRNKACFPALTGYLAKHGRGSYIKPLFVELHKTDAAFAKEQFEKNKNFYQAVVAKAVAKTVGSQYP